MSSLDSKIDSVNAKVDAQYETIQVIDVEVTSQAVYLELLGDEMHNNSG